MYMLTSSLPGARSPTRFTLLSAVLVAATACAPTSRSTIRCARCAVRRPIYSRPWCTSPRVQVARAERRSDLAWFERVLFDGQRWEEQIKAYPG